MTRIARWAATLLAGLMMLGASNALAQMRTAPPGGMCGGIAGFQCPYGQHCVMTGPRYPDQSGVCRNEQPPAPRGDGHTLCPTIFRPVCGADGRTYSNSCMAQARDVPIAHDGQCGLAPPRPGPPPPRVCPDIYRPVCGRDGRTYPNRCVARESGAWVRHDGRCRYGRAYDESSPRDEPRPLPYGAEQPAPYAPPPPSPRPRYGERG